MLAAKTRSSGDEEVDKTLWEQAADEVAKGWLVGPFESCSHLTEALGIQNPVLSRRFPISQGSKLRAIDDFKESQINDTYGKCDKLWLMDIDSIVSMIRLIEQTGTGACRDILMGDGKSLSVSDPLIPGSDSWVGATFDLHAAYKQLHVHPEDRWASIISLYSPYSDSAKVFAQVVLPFGASASVTSFNRIARFMWYVGCKDLTLVWANFFDDYPVLSRNDTASTSLKSIELFFSLLGWQTAGGEKAASFSECFSALGVKFDLHDLANRKSFVQNTEKRISAIVSMIAHIKDKACMTSFEAESLRGRLQFMETGFFGRVGKSVIMSLRVNHRSDKPKLNSSDVKALAAILTWLECDKPRLISPPVDSKGCLLFTDGACEGFDKGFPTVTCGALLINLDTGERLLFGTKVADPLVTKWVKELQKKQLVTEAEMFAVLISFRLWFEFFVGKKVIIFVDSEPTMFSFIK